VRGRLAQGWDRFWFAPIDPDVVAIFRVALGLYVIALFASLAPNWELYNGPDGIMSFGDPLIQNRPENWWSLMTWTRGFVPVYAFWGATMLAAGALTIGWHPRSAVIFLFVLHTSIVHGSPSTANGEDSVLRGLLFCSCFLRFDVTTGRGPERWPLRMIQLFTCLIYVFTQGNKLAWEELWRNGEVMYVLSHSAVWGRFPWPLPQLLQIPAISKAATWGSLTVELGFPLLVWIPALRRLMIGLLALLHVTIAICIVGASFFNVVMFVCLCAFLTDDDVRRIRSRFSISR